MITLRLDIRPDSADQQNLVLRDETGDYNEAGNPGGYGFPNIERTDVDYVVVTIDWPDGSQTQQNYNYKPTAPLYLSALGIAPQRQSMAGTYATGPSSIATAFVSSFPDGFYRVTYSIYTRKNIPNRQCLYSATGPYKNGCKVYAIKNGGWFDVTSEITYVSVENTIVGFKHETSYVSDSYSIYQVRDSEDKLFASGVYEKGSCVGSDTVGVSSEPVMVAAATQEFTLVNKTLQVIAPKVFQTLNSEATTPDEQKTREDIVLAMGQLLYLKEVPSRRRNFETFPVIYALLF